VTAAAKPFSRVLFLEFKSKPASDGQVFSFSYARVYNPRHVGSKDVSGSEEVFLTFSGIPHLAGNLLKGNNSPLIHPLDQIPLRQVGNCPQSRRSQTGPTDLPSDQLFRVQPGGSHEQTT
jgi:hypothetical protein